MLPFHFEYKSFCRLTYPFFNIVNDYYPSIISNANNKTF